VRVVISGDEIALHIVSGCVRQDGLQGGQVAVYVD
jgi:hypothetical protein